MSSSPGEPTLVDGNLTFAATVPSSTGCELYRWTPPCGYVQDLGFSGSGMRLRASQPVLGLDVTFRGTSSPAG